MNVWCESLRVGVKTQNEIPHDFKNVFKKPFKKESIVGILKIEESYFEINEIAIKLKHYKINEI